MYSAIIEDFVIPEFRNLPGCDDYYFHEEGNILLLPGMYKSRVQAKTFIPLYANGFPTSFGERAAKEKMIQVLINPCSTQDTVCVFLGVHVPSSQHCLGV